jgi:predicted DNA-binding transcriptional regulator AlpA
MRLITFGRLAPEKGIFYSRDHLRRKCNAGEFPKPIPISEKRIAWDEHEINAWLASKREVRDAGKAEARGAKPEARGGASQ